MIDVDNSGTLTKQEIITAVKENKEVKMFLANCGNENLQYLLVPSRLNHALSVLDKDGDDEIDANEWCKSESETSRRAHRLFPHREDAIAKALQKKLEQRRAMREANAEAFRKEIEEFTANFLKTMTPARSSTRRSVAVEDGKEPCARTGRPSTSCATAARRTCSFCCSRRFEKALAQLRHGQFGRSGHRRMYRPGVLNRCHPIDATPARRRGSKSSAEK